MMGDSDSSDCHSYDTDQDAEYMPPKKKSKKETWIKIRGHNIKIPRSSSSSSEREDTISDVSKRTNKSGIYPSTSTTEKSVLNRKIVVCESEKNIVISKPPSMQQTTVENDTRSKPNCTVAVELANSDTPTEEFILVSNERQITRKRKNNASEWACNIRKARFDQGLEYISSRKKRVPAKKITNKKDCFQKCTLKCSRKISDEQRNDIFKSYYSLSSAEKKNYILNTTEVDVPCRRRKGKTQDNSQKSRTFRYYFKLNGQKLQVCKVFYTGTLCISQKPIYNVHKSKTLTNTIPASIQGKHKKRVTSPEDTNFVKEHINMLPRVESHYCRKTTKKEYLESDMNIKKMYELYLDYAMEKERPSVSFCVYRKIFCNSFNIGFHKPRKDRCDTCEEMKIKQKENRVDENSEVSYKNHIEEKENMRKEKQKDKESGTPILCFDLENVLTCPKADIKNFFYKSKLNVYNMTAHLSSNTKKEVYCAIWTEALHGRTGNDIASAVYKILQRVFKEHPDFTEIILWSDSCIPQNRNSLMSYALTHLFQTHKNLQKVTMKFSVPGHSCIQEVDAIHSSIERSLNKVEYYSPLSLIRFLLKVNRQNPYTIIQMQKQDFIDFQFYSNQLNYNTVPFSKIVCLQFSRSFFELKYKTSFKPTDEPNESKIVNLHQRKLRKAQNPTMGTEPSIPSQLKKIDNNVSLPEAKVDAIKSMYKWLPEVDKQYYASVIRPK